MNSRVSMWAEDLIAAALLLAWMVGAPLLIFSLERAS